VRNILVLGGNHYFGKKLVKVLLDNNDKVTLLNRGNLDDGFGEQVKRIVCDRHNKAALTNAITKNYDIVFDQSCFDYDQAKIACEVFNGKVNKYIFTSSVSAYNAYGSGIKEDLFDPNIFQFTQKETMDSNYGEAKRQAEVSFYKYANFPVTALRFPIVLDENDATDRLQYHVTRIRDDKSIYFTNLELNISFVSARDAAKAMFKLSQNDFSGPINVASSKPIRLKKFMGFIETATHKKIILAKERHEDNASPYSIGEDWFMDCTQLEELGIKLEPIEDYLPRMIQAILGQK
jgi:nucleoside-diphosphate-sugar epimerase